MRRNTFLFLILSLFVVAVVFVVVVPDLFGANPGPPKQDADMSIKVTGLVIQAAIFIGSLLGAVWFLSSLIGKLKSELVEQKGIIQSMQKSFDAMQLQLSENRSSHRDIWKETNAIRERITIIEGGLGSLRELSRDVKSMRERLVILETRCDSRHIKEITGEHLAVKNPSG